MKSYKFIQAPSLFKIMLMITMFFFCALIVSLAIIIEQSKNIFFVLLIIPIFCFLFSVFCLVNYFLLYVEMKNNQIIIKNIFGTRTSCEIANIKKIYCKDFFREGTFFIIIDEKNRANAKKFSRKNSYVRFEKNQKSLGLLKEIWGRDIEQIVTDEEWLAIK